MQASPNPVKSKSRTTFCIRTRGVNRIPQETSNSEHAHVVRRDHEQSAGRYSGQPTSYLRV